MRQCTPYSDIPVLDSNTPHEYPKQNGERNKYEPYLDKITENEMVPDIVHRLTLDEELTCDSGIIADRHDYLDQLLSKICRTNHYPSELEQYNKLLTATIKIAAGETSGSTNLPLENNYFKLLAAYSKQTGMDYRSMIETSVENSTITLTLSVPVAFSNDDEIQVFVV